MADRALALLQAGLVSGVGLSAAASCAALRGAIDNFRETRFIDGAGDWIIGSPAPLDTALCGRASLVQMLATAIAECLDRAGHPDPVSIPLLLCVAERTRPGRVEGIDEELYREVERELAVRFHPRYSLLLPHGRVSAAIAMSRASELVHEEGLPFVLVAATDSLLVSSTLAGYELKDRLLTKQNSNGFVPGEAAGALLVGPPAAATYRKLRCIGYGFGLERATIGSHEVLRAEGLTQAFKQALTGAGLAMADIGYRIGTMSGEQFWFKQFDLATARLLRGKHDFMDLWHPAVGIGETGATAMLACLVVTLNAVQKGYAAGDHVLVTAANDDGRCAALVLSASDSP